MSGSMIIWPRKGCWGILPQGLCRCSSRSQTPTWTDSSVHSRLCSSVTSVGGHPVPLWNSSPFLCPMFSDS